MKTQLSKDIFKLVEDRYYNRFSIDQVHEIMGRIRKKDTLALQEVKVIHNLLFELNKSSDNSILNMKIVHGELYTIIHDTMILRILPDEYSIRMINSNAEYIVKDSGALYTNDKSNKKNTKRDLNTFKEYMIGFIYSSIE